MRSAGLGNAYLCLEEHEEAIASYQKSFDFVFYTIGKSRIIADRKPCEKHNLSSATWHDELSDKYKRQLEDYFEQHKGEHQAEIVKNVRRLNLLCR